MRNNYCIKGTHFTFQTKKKTTEHLFITYRVGYTTYSMKELNEQGLRRRKSIKNLKLSHPNSTDHIKPLHYNDNNKMYNKLSQRYISYIDKTPLTHHTKSDSRMINIIEISVICGVFLTGYFVYHYSDRMYIPIMKFYAHLGIKVSYILYKNLCHNKSVDLVNFHCYH